MKKRRILPLFCAMLCAAAVTVTMAGCGDSIATKDVTLSNISNAVASHGTAVYNHSMNISDLTAQYSIVSGDVLQFVAKSQEGTGAAMVMIEASSDDAARRIEENLNLYVGMFSRVGMDTVVRYGNYVALFSDANDEQMAAAFKEFVVAE